MQSPVPVAVIGLRGRYNERQDFLMSSTPPVNEVAAPATERLFIPHMADSGGYTTQFVLFTGESARPVSGYLTLNPSSPWQ